MALSHPSAWTEAQYLAFERESDQKHEFINGQVLAMSGASRAHNLIVASTIAALTPQVRKQSCKIFPSDMRVHVPDTEIYTYPDISVVCGEDMYTDDTFNTLTNPSLIVKVLSDSTESYDRGKKFQNYRRIPSLMIYLLIAQDQARIERYTRQSAKDWLLTEFAGRDNQLELPQIHSNLRLGEVYDQVTFEA